MPDLETYRKKRDFSRTPEPSGAPSDEAGRDLLFVVHKHAARRLHYDLRLEAGGTMKSWAVPKGPSLDPSMKRLAMMVEDHPLDYRNFEGTIPEGSYGAGTVMIWDEGTYRVPGASSRRQAEKMMDDGVQQGKITVILSGEKLKGEFHLAKMRGAEKNAWLLFKKRDEFSTGEEILFKDRSVRSGLSMEEIRTGAAPETGGRIRPDIGALDLSDAARGEIAWPVRPMLARLVKEPFDRRGWLFEVKWDGYRAIAEIRRNQPPKLYSRNSISFVADYPPVVADLERLNFDAVLDGEVVVANEQGRASFELLQNYRRAGRGTPMYYVFDLLWLEGYDLRPLPLFRRKELLKRVLPDLPHVKYNDHVEERGRDLFKLTRELGLEGMVAKDGRSRYQDGIRSPSWEKVKASLQQEMVVGGFTQPRGSRKGIGALAVGVYEGKELVFAGLVGGGFSERALDETFAKLMPLIRDECPFTSIPALPGSVTWVEPRLVCEVRFQEWTDQKIMRQPIFLGMREDVEPAQIGRELAAATEEPKRRFTTSKDATRSMTIGGHRLQISNPDKLYWPRDGITKSMMIDYYREVAPVMLPHLMDRPQSLHRYPDGIDGEGFFQKNVTDYPEWAKTVVIDSESEVRPIRYLLCEDEASLIYIAGLGSFEFNPWISRVNSEDYPDYMVIDLDPHECGFDKVIEAAMTVRQVLQEIACPGYIKTSGATGMHVFIPLGAQYTYDQSRLFSQLVCMAVNRRLPESTSLERLPERRRGLVYLDYLQNFKAKTMAAAYSLRPHDGAPVSAPLEWDEVGPDLSPAAFNLRTMPGRIKRHGDLFAPVLGKGIDMQAHLARLKELL